MKQKRKSILVIAIVISALFFALFLNALSVQADLKFLPLEKHSYNIGDRIIIKGTASANSTSATLLLSTACDTGTASNLGVKNIYFSSPGKMEAFSYSMNIGKEATGNCRLVGVMTYQATSPKEQETNNETMQSQDSVSEEFKISQELKGEFDINQTLLQYGQITAISGEIKKLDNSPVTGLVKLYFKQNEANYLVEDIEVKNGKFVYAYESSKSPPGKYYVKAEANDLYGNSLSSEIGTFEISNKLIVNMQIDKQEYLPRENIIINGTALPEMQLSLSEADVTFTIGGTEYKARVIKNSFNHLIALPKDIKSGEHTLTATVRDKIGNEGKASTKLRIRAVPTKLINEINPKSYFPGAKASVTPFLYDQANELMEEEGLLFVLSPAKALVYNTTINFGQPIEFEIPKLAPPGTYVIRTISGSIAGEEVFTVQQLEALELKFLNKTITAENTGNIAYTKTLVIKAADENGKISEIYKKFKIKPGDSEDIILENELESGTYTLILPKTFSQEEQLFYNISIEDKRTAFKKMSDGIGAITGNAIAVGKPGSWLPLILILGIIMSIFVVRAVYRRKFARHYANEAHENAPEDKIDVPEDKIGKLSKNSDEVAEDYVLADKDMKKAENQESENEEEKTDDPILKKYYEKKHEKENKPSDGPLRNDPQIKRFVSDTLKRALPEAEKEDKNEEMNKAMNEGLETKIKEE